MKKVISKLLEFLFLSGFIFILSTCEVGLGETVDTEYPSIEISYPPVNAKIRDTFMLFGSWNDDKGVSDISVSVMEVSSKKEFTTKAVINADNTWSVNLNEKDESNPKYNGWQFADGTYQVSVTVQDAAGHKTNDTRQFVIDNTPPVFIISNPGVVKSSGLEASSYGSVFTIEGNIADDNEIAIMDVSIYDENGVLVSNETYNEEQINFFREEEIATAGGTSVTIAQWADVPSVQANNRYIEVYGDNSSAGDKKYYASITLYDNTQVYQDPAGAGRNISGNSPDSFGNATSSLYLYDDVFKSLMSAKQGLGLSAADLKKIINGTMENSLVLNMLNNKKTDTMAGENSRLCFTLNPQANPTYQVNGFAYNFDPEANLQTASAGNSVSVTISQGLDGIKVDPANVKVWMKQFDVRPAEQAPVTAEVEALVGQVTNLELAETDFVEYTKATAEKPVTSVNDWKLIYDYGQNNKKGSTVTTKTFSVTLPENSIKLNTYYVIVVTGRDEDEVVFNQNVVYGFEGNEAGIAPTILVNKPAELGLVKSTAKEELVFEGVAKVNSSSLFVTELDFSVSVTDEETGRSVGTSGSYTDSLSRVTVDAPWVSQNGAVEWLTDLEKILEDGSSEIYSGWRLTPENLPGYNEIEAVVESGKSYLYVLEIEGKSSSGHISTATANVHIDTSVPSVEITSITPTVSGEEFDSSDNIYVNGDLVIKGNVQETNLENVTVKVFANGVEVDSFDKGKVYSFNQYIDTTDYADDVDLEIKVVAKDSVGNTNTYSSKTDNPSYSKLHILQETDRPSIRFDNADSTLINAAGINVDTNLFGTNTNNKLQISLSDDDKITEYRIYLYDEDGNPCDNNSYAGNPKYDSTNKVLRDTPEKSSLSINYILPTTPGIYKLRIEARDWLINGLPGNSDENHLTGLKTVGPFFVAVDAGAPIVSVTSPASGSYVLGEFAVTGEVSPASKAFGNGTTITAKFVDDDGAELASQPAVFEPVYGDGQTSWTGTDWKGKFSLTNGDQNIDGAYYVLFTAKDKYGQSSSSILKFAIDNTPPTITPTAPAQLVVLENTEYINLSVATAFDAYSGLNAIYFYATKNDITLDSSNYDSVQWTQMNRGASGYNGNLKVSDVQNEDGDAYIFFAAADNANNWTLSSRYTMTVDKTLPRLSVKKNSVSLSDGENIIANDTSNVFEVTVTDSNVASLACEPANAHVAISAPQDLADGKKYTVTVTNGGDDKQTARLVAKDANENQAIFSFSVDCDNAKPVVTMDTYENNYGTNSLTLSGTVVDKHFDEIELVLTDKTNPLNKKVATVTYKNDNSDETGNTKLFTAKFYEISDGNYEVSYLAKDTYGNQQDSTTAGLHDINFDSVSPTTSIKLKQPKTNKLLDNSDAHVSLGNKTDVESNSTFVLFADDVDQLESVIYTNSNSFTLSGEVVEGNFNAATFRKNSISVTPNPISQAGEWTFTESALADGAYKYSIEISDLASHNFRKDFTVIVDTKAPDFDFTSPTDRQSFSNAPSIKGSYSDDGIGIKELKYHVYNITDTSVESDSNRIAGVTSENGTATWSLTLPSTFTANDAPEGTFKVVASVTDYFGNESDVAERLFFYDRNNPTMTEDAVTSDGVMTNAAFALAGTVSDTNALYGYDASAQTAAGSVSIKVMVGAEEKTYEAETSAATGKKAADWNYNFVVGSANSAEPNYLPDGSYNFTIIAKDTAAKTYQISRTVKVDTEAPKFGTGVASQDNTTDVAPYVTTSSRKDANGVDDWYNTSNLRFAGTASDAGGTGIASVQYSTDGTNFSDFAGTTSWSGNVSELVSNETVVTIKITDNAGNENLRVLGPWKIDETKPSLVDNSVKLGSAYPAESEPELVTANSILANGTKDIYISGSVKDNDDGSGIARVNILPANSSLVLPENDAVLDNGNFKFKIKNDTITGNGSVYARIFDYAGNFTDTTLFSINFDNKAPVVKMNNPSDADTSIEGLQVNGKISISGTASDDNTFKQIQSIQYSDDNASWITLINDSDYAALVNKVGYKAAGSTYNVAGDYSWTASEIDTTLFASGTAYFRAVGVDTAANIGNSASIKLDINQNTDRPTVKVTNLIESNGEYFLKYGTNAQVSGSIVDDDTTSTAVVARFIASDSAFVFNGDVLDESKLTGTTDFKIASGEWTFTPSNTDDGEKKVFFYIEDNAGVKFYTGQASGLKRPYFQYKTDAAIDNAASISYKSDSKSPVIADTTATDYSKAGVKASDSNSLMASYVIGGSDKSKIQFVIKATDASGIAGLTADLYYTTGSGDSLTTHYVANKKTVNADVTSIAGVALVESGFTYESDKANFDNTSKSTEATWTTGVIDISAVPTGSITLNITPYDNAGLAGNQSYTFTVDNSAPAIKVQSPAMREVVTGSIQIQGQATDSGSAGTADIFWLIPTRTQVSTANSKATDAERYEYLKNLEWSGGRQALAEDATESSWVFNFDGLANAKLEEFKDEYAISVVSSVYELPIYFMAVDNRGNCSIKEDYVLKSNPDGNKPKLDITYPTLSDYDKNNEGVSLGYVTLGGTIRVTGSAIIPSNKSTVKATYIQIASASAQFDSADKSKVETKYGLTAVSAYQVLSEILGRSVTVANDAEANVYGFVTKAEMDAWWGIKTNGTASWNIPLNADGKMNSDNSDTNNITLRACGVNEEGKFGPWTGDDNLISIHIDDAAPTITPAINQYAVELNATNIVSANKAIVSNASQSYLADMFLRGKWYLVIDALDESGITTLNVKDSSGALMSAGTDYYVAEINSEGSIKIVDATTAKKGKKVFIPITGISNAEYTVTAIDSDGTSHTATQTFSFNIDNTPPTLEELQGGSEDFTPESVIKNRDYVYTISGVSRDEGSGFERVVFYYMRENKVLIDPMIITGTDDTKVAWADLKPLSITQGDASYTLYANTYTGTVETDSFTANSDYDVHIRVGGLVLLDGIYRRITTMNARKVEFEPALSATSSALGNNVDVDFVLAQVVDNTSSENTTSMSSKPITFKSGDDGDLMPESVTKTGKTWKWDATIQSDNMPDGPVSLVILAFDSAGNVNGKTINTTIANNTPRLAKVFFGTDFNNNNNFEDGEFESYSIIAKEGVEQVKNLDSYHLDLETFGEDFGAGVFTVKNKLAVIPELMGGNGRIDMVVKKDAVNENPVTSAAGTLVSSIAAGTSSKDALSGVTSATLVATDASTYRITSSAFASAAAGNNFYAYVLDNKTLDGVATDAGVDEAHDGTGKGFSFTFWDSTEETVRGTNSQNTVLRVSNFTFDLVDGVGPTVVVNPFYWNSRTSNSLYANSSANGHIELEDDLPAAITSDAAWGSDPKVSGKITFTGTAYDDHSLKALSFKFSGFGGGAAHSIATYNPATSEWTATAATIDADGYEVSVSIDSENGNFDDTAYFNQAGHKVYWTLSIDTSKISGHALKNAVLQILAVDLSDNSGKTTVVQPVKTDGKRTVVDGTTNVPEYQMDVVPYITNVETELSSLSKKTPSVYSRTALGHYPVRVIGKDQTAESGENVIITGFNLDRATITVNAKSMYDKTQADAKTKATSYAYEVEVNGVKSLNNINNDNAKGSYEGEISDSSTYEEKNTYAYNRQPNNVNNNLLTDDVYFDVWQFNSQAAVPISGKIEQPVMKIRPTDGKIGFAFVNGPLYFSMGGSPTVEDYSYQYWTASYDFFTSIGFAYDSFGNSYGVGAGGDINSGSGDAFIMASSKYGIGAAGQRGSYDGANNIRLERIAEYDTNGVLNFDKQRIKSPSIATSKSGTDSTNVYLAYYDGLNDELRFKSGNTSAPATIRTETNQSWIRKIISMDNPDSKYAGGWMYKNGDDGTLDIANGDHVYFCTQDGTLLSDICYTMNGFYNPDGEQCAFTIGVGGGERRLTPFIKPIKDEGEYAYTQEGNFRNLNEDIYIKIVKTTTVNSSKEFGQFKDSAGNSSPTYSTANVSILASNAKTYGAGSYVDLAVVPASITGGKDCVVAVWYDQSDAVHAVLRYAYNSDPIDHPDTWTYVGNVFNQNGDEAKAGEYCKVTVDGEGGVHIAAYDPVNLDLCYAYLPSSKKGAAASASDFNTAIVDANGVVGSNLTLDVALVGGKPVPYIGYYATSCIKPKYARFVGSSLTSGTIDGSVDDEVTGKWEIAVVPTEQVVEMQSNQHNDINIAVWKNEAGSIINSTTGSSYTENYPSLYNSNSYGQCYGNGTKNAVLGYAVKNGASGDTIETAQMK